VTPARSTLLSGLSIVFVLVSLGLVTHVGQLTPGRHDRSCRRHCWRQHETTRRDGRRETKPRSSKSAKQANSATSPPCGYGWRCLHNFTLSYIRLLAACEDVTEYVVTPAASVVFLFPVCSYISRPHAPVRSPNAPPLRRRKLLAMSPMTLPQNPQLGPSKISL